MMRYTIFLLLCTACHPSIYRGPEITTHIQYNSRSPIPLGTDIYEGIFYLDYENSGFYPYPRDEERSAGFLNRIIGLGYSCYYDSYASPKADKLISRTRKNTWWWFVRFEGECHMHENEKVIKFKKFHLIEPIYLNQ